MHTEFCVAWECYGMRISSPVCCLQPQYGSDPERLSVAGCSVTLHCHMDMIHNSGRIHKSLVGLNDTDDDANAVGHLLLCTNKAILRELYVKHVLEFYKIQPFKLGYFMGKY